MNYLTTTYDSVMLGVGDLYLCLASEFTAGTTTEDDMTDIGYIKESATFTRTHDTVELTSANKGKITNIASNYTTEFDTGVISYKAENVRKFLTGSKSETISGTGTSTDRTYFGKDDNPPEVALVFVGTDAESGKTMRLVLPKCQWTGDYELDFNSDDPVELNYHFTALDVTMPNGKVGAGWIDEVTNTSTSETTSTSEP